MLNGERLKAVQSPSLWRIEMGTQLARDFVITPRVATESEFFPFELHCSYVTLRDLFTLFHPKPSCPFFQKISLWLLVQKDKVLAVTVLFAQQKLKAAPLRLAAVISNSLCYYSHSPQAVQM